MKTVPLICVTGHALERLAERSTAPPDPKTVRLDVASALRAGRVAKRAPAWLGEYRGRVRGPGTKRFVWTETESRCYVILRQRSPKGPSWCVLTVMGPEEERARAVR